MIEINLLDLSTKSTKRCGAKVYWQHLGMMQVPEYRERWENKFQWHKQQGILPFDEGKGSEGTLLATMDDERGDIQSDEIEKVLGMVLIG